MSARKQREQIPGALFLRFSHGCPVCDGDVDLLDHSDNVFSLVVRHEPGCPAHLRQGAPHE